MLRRCFHLLNMRKELLTHVIYSIYTSLVTIYMYFDHLDVRQDQRVATHQNWTLSNQRTCIKNSLLPGPLGHIMCQLAAMCAAGSRQWRSSAFGSKQALIDSSKQRGRVCSVAVQASQTGIQTLAMTQQGPGVRSTLPGCSLLLRTRLHSRTTSPSSWRQRWPPVVHLQPSNQSCAATMQINNCATA